LKHVLFVAALGLPFALSALAESDPSAEAQTVLDPVVVTATRTPERADRTLAAVSVVDRATIEKRQLRSVPDALRGLPGVTVSSSGGVASVYLRGTNSDSVLVLVDGVKVGSATLGTTPWADLPIQQIERIEVVRGPRSSLYGSKAIGGVIQIFTRRGGGDLTPRVTVTGGSFNTAAISGGLSGGGEHAWFNLSGDFAQTDGFNACYGQIAPFAGCGVFEPDRDAATQLGGSARLGYRFSERAEIDLSYLGANTTADFDGTRFSGNRSRSAQQVYGARTRLVPFTPWVVTLAAGYSLDKYTADYSDAEVERVAAGDFDTQRDSLTWQNDISILAGHLLSLGVDYQRDRIASSVTYAEDSRADTGVFGEYQGEWRSATMNLSLRQDDNEQFGSYTTGSAALGYRFAPALQASVSYGTAFKAPTFNELYYPFFGNPDLDPEESNSLELGFDGALPESWVDGRWALNLYHTELDQMIAFDAFTQGANNIAQAEIQGLELSANAAMLDWDLGFSLTLLDPRNRSAGQDDGNLLPRRPQQQGQLDLDRRFARWSLGATLFAAGRSYDDLANVYTLDPYTLLDLRAEYAFTPSLRLQGRLKNVFDQDYETAAFYNQPGRAFYLTLRYEPVL